MAWICKADAVSDKKRKTFEELEMQAIQKHAMKMALMKGQMTTPQQLAIANQDSSEASGGGASSMPGSSSRPDSSAFPKPDVVIVDPNENGASASPQDNDRSPSPSQSLVPVTAAGPAGASQPPSQPPGKGPSQPPSPTGSSGPKESESSVPSAKDRQVCEECGKFIPSSCCGDQPDLDTCPCPRCPICWDRISKDEKDVEVLDCMHVSWPGQCISLT